MVLRLPERYTPEGRRQTTSGLKRGPVGSVTTAARRPSASCQETGTPCGAGIVLAQHQNTFLPRLSERSPKGVLSLRPTAQAAMGAACQEEMDRCLLTTLSSVHVTVMETRNIKPTPVSILFKDSSSERTYLHLQAMCTLVFIHWHQTGNFKIKSPKAAPT